MALVDHEPMTDATGQTHMYRPVPSSANPDIPKYPHPDAAHQAHRSGWGIHPCTHIRDTIQRYLDWCTNEGVEPDHPIDGDQTTRWAHQQCWDDVIGRNPGQKFFTGTEPCENPNCPHPKPHCAGQWFSDHRPRFRDIAHVLYPGGRVPWPLGFNGPRIYGPGPDLTQWQPFQTPDPPAPAPTDHTPPPPAEPVQLDLLDFLEDHA